MRILLLVMVTVLFGGCRGPTGPQGPQGPQGPPGEGVEASTFCWMSDGPQDFGYSVVEYANGDVWVFCEISDSASTYSSARYYVSGEPGAEDHACFVTYDLEEEPSYGFWTFALDAGEYTVEYFDPDSEDDGLLLVFDEAPDPEDGCRTIQPGA